jgi:GT2 family glycosyltransferase
MISHLLMQPPGHNEGVGEAVRKCFAVAQGSLLIKVDQDLVYVPQWLKTTRDILDGDDHVGAVGMFPYHHDPCDVEKTRVLDGERDGHFYVTDFVGSCFAIPRHVYEEAGPIETHSTSFSEDVGLKDRIRRAGYELALPDEALAVNVGFGYGPSTVCVEPDNGENNGGVCPINHKPVVFDGSWS